MLALAGSRTVQPHARTPAEPVRHAKRALEQVRGKSGSGGRERVQKLWMAKESVRGYSMIPSVEVSLSRVSQAPHRFSFRHQPPPSPACHPGRPCPSGSTFEPPCLPAGRPPAPASPAPGPALAPRPRHRPPRRRRPRAWTRSVRSPPPSRCPSAPPWPRPSALHRCWPAGRGRRRRAAGLARCRTSRRPETPR